MKLDRFTLLILFVLTFALIFVYTTVPNSSIKESANWNLLTLGALSGFVFLAITQKGFIESFKIQSGAQFFSQMIMGLFLGIILSIFSSFIVATSGALINLTSSISFGSIVASTSSEIFFIGIIQPLSETILMVIGLYIVYNFLKESKLPFAKPIAILLVSLGFTALHFVVLGRGNYEYSVDGFLSFIFDMKNFGTTGYTGALPILVLSIGWSILAFGYQSYVIVWFAHMANNLMALYFAGVTGDSLFILNTIVLMFIMVGIIVFSKYGVQNIYDFKLSRVLS